MKKNMGVTPRVQLEPQFPAINCNKAGTGMAFKNGEPKQLLKILFPVYKIWI
jgi:hypothetical protein